MACGMDFRKPRLGEYAAAPSSLCLIQYLPEVSYRLRYELIKGLELYYKRCVSVIKILRKLTIYGIFIRQEKRKYSHVERQGVQVHLKRVK